MERRWRLVVQQLRAGTERGIPESRGCFEQAVRRGGVEKFRAGFSQKGDDDGEEKKLIFELSCSWKRYLYYSLSFLY